MYCVRDNKIFKVVKIDKHTKKGNGVWCLLEGMTKLKMVSLSNIYPTHDEAMSKLRRR